MRAETAIAFAALLSFLIGGQALSAETSPVGLWQAFNPDTKQPSGWFAITEHDGVYDGTLVKMFLEPGQSPTVVCDKCRDDRHNQPWLGIQIIRGMKRNADNKDNKYDGGTILDPRNGNVYHAMMTLTPDGQTLIVRGYLGVSFLGRNEYWVRLPNSDLGTLDPSIKSMLDPLIRSAPVGAPANR
jgi:uncharacterized protein (DUF2147 family)